jgi:peptidyl-prolyl cis-trans isomerase D
MGPLLGEEYADQFRRAMREELGVSRNPSAIEAVRTQLTGS